MTSQPFSGEDLVVLERVIVAPTAGQFRPRTAGETTDAGPVIAAGDTVGYLDSPGDSQAVPSPFEGRLMGMLAHPGERVREGQPLAWLRVA